LVGSVTTSAACATGPPIIPSKISISRRNCCESFAMRVISFDLRIFTRFAAQWQRRVE
jgi:hypothetical protein